MVLVALLALVSAITSSWCEPIVNEIGRRFPTLATPRKFASVRGAVMFVRPHGDAQRQSGSLVRPAFAGSMDVVDPNLCSSCHRTRLRMDWQLCQVAS